MAGGSNLGMDSEGFSKLLSGVKCREDLGCLVLEVPQNKWIETAKVLRDHPECLFSQLTDLCVVDYLSYGVSDWQTTQSTSSGFGRAQIAKYNDTEYANDRFVVVVHLLSLKYRQRIRLRVLLDNDNLSLPSLVDIWPCANWYEREAYDLFGVVFQNHPDLRRILTDYGFVGYPFRKDFPLEGFMEKRYDAQKGMCVNEPMSEDPSSIQPRIGVPKVIREDNRYEREDERAS